MIGFLGGTFDPIHNGHLHAARCAAMLLSLSRVHLVLAARPVHRVQPSATIAQRSAMLELAVGGDTLLAADDREVRRGTRSYTVETLEELRREWGVDASLVWLLGWDAYRGLPTWRRWRELLGLAHIAVLRRPGSEPDLDATMTGFTAAHRVDDAMQLHKTAAGCVLIFSAPMLPISSTDIRARLAHGDDASQLLPSTVWTYIDNHQLYARPSR